MIAYFITNDTILNVNNKHIDFKHNINKIIEAGDLLIVHIFDSIEKKGILKMSEQPLNGVYAVDAYGDLQWNVKDIVGKDEMYTGISKDSNGNLIVVTFMGIAKVIDVNSKQTIGKWVTK